MGKNNIMTKYVGNNFLGNTLCRSFRELVVSVVLVSWWSVNFVSVVVGVLVALWCCVRSVLTVSGDFGSFCGVLAVFRWCLGGIEGMVFSCFFTLNWFTCQHKNPRQRKHETLLLGL